MKEPRRCSACGSVLPENRLMKFCPLCTWKEIANVDNTEVPRAASTELLMRVPGHTVISEIARGGMGIVYRAQQLDPSRHVALKMLLPHQVESSGMIERFQMEVRALTALDHPAILPVYQVGEQNGMPFFTMKFAGGGTLAQRKAKLMGCWRAIGELMATLADAVAFAHEHGVLHRDLKPGNVLFDEADRAYVSDFGLAKLLSDDTDLTRSMDVLGTPHYLAPEVAAGSVRQATTASDVYSLGAILYELLTSRPPFEAEGLPALLRKIADEELVPPSRVWNSRREESKIQNSESRASRLAPGVAHGIPRDLEVICLKCLAKAPIARYGTAREFAQDLRLWLAGRPILARPASATKRLVAWTRRNPAVATLAVALLVAVSISGVVLMHTNRRLAKALQKSQQSEGEATRHLYDSMLTQARAQRASGQMGQRFDTLETIRQAAAIRPSLELRTETAAALARPDFRLVCHLQRYYATANSILAFTPDFRRYACGDSKGFVIRATSDGIVVRRFNGSFGNAADVLVFSQDGQWLGVVDRKGNMEVWGVDEPQPVWTLPAGQTKMPVLPAFHPDGTGFAYAAANGEVRFRLFNGQQEQTLAPEGLRVIAISFSPFGDQLIVSRTEALELWSSAMARPIWSLALVPSGAIPAWRADGSFVAVGEGKSGDVMLIEAGEGKVERTFHGHSRQVLDLAFHPDGMNFASIGLDRVLRFWEVESGTEILRCPAAPRGVYFSSDGRLIGFAPENIAAAVFELAPATTYRRFTSLRPATNDLSKPIHVSGNGQLVCTADGHQAQFWDARTGSQGAAFDVSIKEIVSIHLGSGGYSLPFDFALGVARAKLTWNAETADGNPVEADTEHANFPTPDSALLRISPDGRFWLVQGPDKQLAIWSNGRKGAERVMGKEAKFRSAKLAIAMSPDARWLAGERSPEGGLSVWDTVANNWAAHLPLQRHTAVAFTPDGKWLLAGTARGYRAWETSSWREVARWPTLLSSVRGGVYPSPDSRLAVLAQDRGRAQLIAIGTWKELLTLTPPSDLNLRFLVWSPDSQRIFIPGPREQVWEWNLKELRKELAALGLDWQDY